MNLEDARALAELLRAIAGDIRALLPDFTQFDDVAAELRAAEQAIKRAAARVETAP